MRDVMFALALIVAAASIVIGVGHWSHGVAFIVAGVLLAVIAWLVLGGETAAVAPEDGEAS